MKKRIILYNVLLVIAFCACTKVVQLDLRTAPPVTVIEANITDQPGPYTVKITQTTGFYDSNSFKSVTGAKVTIRDGVGAPFVLTDEGGGIYVTDALQGAVGHTYFFTAIVGKDTFSAVSTMPQRVNLDSIYCRTVKAGGKNVIVAVPSFTQPEGELAYFFFDQTINGYLDKTLYYATNQFSEGLANTFPLERNSSDSTLHSGDTVEVEMQCIDSAMYNYWKSADLAAVGSGPAYPGNPVTNLTGGALGYFSAHTSQVKGVRVP